MKVGHVIAARDPIHCSGCRKCWPECDTL